MERIQQASQDFYKWALGPSTFLVWPEVGAKLMHWFISLADGSTRDVIHWPESPDYSKPRSIRGGNPILFPFAARSYYQGAENYWNCEGKTLPMPRHGFAADAPFEIVDLHPSGFSARLIPQEAFLAYYPFRYSFIVKYYFGELSLGVDLVLKNEDSRPIPWAAGHHFYFHIPWHPHLGRQHYNLSIPCKKGFYHNTDGSLRLVKDLPMPARLDDSSLIDRMHCKLKEPKLSLSSLGGEEKIEIYLSGNPAPSQWTTVTTWSLADAPFYCVEPWMAPANAAEHKQGLAWVEPGESQVFSVRVDLA